MNQAHEFRPLPVIGCECVVCSGRQIKQHNDAVISGYVERDPQTDAQFFAQYQLGSVEAKKSIQDRINKSMPVCTGFLDYFPDAIREVSKVSLAGNKQHNIDGPLTWDRSKSADHADCLVRHQLLRGTRDTDGQLHSAKVAWRAMAQLQIELEQEKATS